ncbi:MAG: hypothetical protein CVT49_15585 [candidate division Zixibacteria bacterium HGW-Zixibacteria-1]|nr:MAG: hypothetical protein CVT49_15585 [candidate division Zixibacteria bacterium HGW-Zixibacteria-1]
MTAGNINAMIYYYGFMEFANRKKNSRESIILTCNINCCPDRTKRVIIGSISGSSRCYKQDCIGIKFFNNILTIAGIDALVIIIVARAQNCDHDYDRENYSKPTSDVFFDRHDIIEILNLYFHI